MTCFCKRTLIRTGKELNVIHLVPSGEHRVLSINSRKNIFGTRVILRLQTLIRREGGRVGRRGKEGEGGGICLFL